MSTASTPFLKTLPGKLLMALVGLFIVVQFVPVDRTNPPVVSEPDWDSPQTKAFAQRACFDCHSNETKWPWYSNVAPASWFLARHVREAREEFNMSEWKPGDGKKAAKQVEKGVMPLKSYLPLHSEAKLSDAEKEQFIQGLKNTFNRPEYSEIEENHENHEHNGE